MDEAQSLSRLRRSLRWLSLFLGLIAIFVVGCIVSPAFIHLDNQRDVLQRVSINGVLAVGMTMVILTAGIDLSVGSMLSLCSVLCAMMLMGRTWTKASGLAIGCMGFAGLCGLVLCAVRLAKGRSASGVACAVAAAVSCAVAWWGWRQVPVGFGVLAVLVFVPAVGALLGSLSGVVIAKGKLQPFIVTLAMMILAVGLAKYVAGKGGQIHAIYVMSEEQKSDQAGFEMLRQQLAQEGKDYASESFAALGRSILTVKTWNERRGEYVGQRLIPVPGLFFLGCVIAAHFVLAKLPFGRYIYAVGGNEETARLSGINVDAVKVGVYAISGTMAGLAAVLYCAMYGQGKADAGQMGELDAIAAVVIGGTSLMGGRGRVVGTLVGVLIFGYLSNILVLKGIPSEVQDILKGLIIVAAVLLQEGRIADWARRAVRRF
jgi:simple sugar transport system permease protein